MAAHDLPIEDQVANVLAGKTASGDDGGKPIAFPAGGGSMALLLRWSNTLPEAPDAVRTAFIRKLAQHIAKRPSVSDHHARELADAVTWFIDHPEQVCTPLTFAGALRRAREDVSFRNAAYDSKARNALRKAMAAPLPMQPVVYDDGTHTLVELVHPAHLIETGLHAWNCLVRRVGGRLVCNRSYWCRIADKSLRIFALWHGPCLLCVLSVGEGALQEWQYVAPPAHVNPVVPAVLAILVQDTGPLRSHDAVIVQAGMFLDRHTQSARIIRAALEGEPNA